MTPVHVDIAAKYRTCLIRGGENISPSEVEAVIQAHPSVAQAAVVDRPRACPSSRWSPRRRCTQGHGRPLTERPYQQE
jgi:acyl-CoA synthetase (AMP-forming)/AMP-acid ligase II